jgi:hypothetical protein
MAASLGLRLGGDIGTISHLGSIFAVRIENVYVNFRSFLTLRPIAIGFDPRIFHAIFTRGGALAS